MKMWRCEECGAVVADDALIRVSGWRQRPEDSFPDYSICPECREDDLEPVEACEYCDGYYSLDDEGIEGCCATCLSAARKSLARFLAGDAEDMTQSEKDIIREYLATI